MDNNVGLVQNHESNNPLDIGFFIVVVFVTYYLIIMVSIIFYLQKCPSLPYTEGVYTFLEQFWDGKILNV